MKNCLYNTNKIQPVAFGCTPTRNFNNALYCINLKGAVIKEVAVVLFLGHFKVYKYHQIAKER